GGHGGAYREALGALLGASHQHHYTAFGSRLEVPFINRLFRIPEIDSILAGLGEIYKGCVFFDSTNSVWKEKLSLVLETL
ncbi:hypothetical protein, partial [Pseudomonas sp. 57B-090624]|uniref:hypothetical protein n=1 Tax=Pseudomonas sp. 57B-090624 TaxID=2213080 RepID=UPI001C45EB49